MSLDVLKLVIQRNKILQRLILYKQIFFFNYSLTFSLIPLQGFSKTWTDEELYKKYKLTQEEIDYIEETIAPME